MIAPPRTIELLLESLGARTDFRDAVLGDLAEELTLRAEREGEDAARRWYYREAIRATPHLLRDWMRSLRARDVTHLANVVFASYFLVTMLGVLFGLIASGVIRTLSFSTGRGSPFMMAFVFTLGVAGTIMGGYIAAWLDRRAPLASALALGVVWSCVGIAVAAVVGVSEPIWYRFFVPVIMVAGTTMGGVLRVRTLRLAGENGEVSVR